MSKTVIQVNNLSKRYRIGLKEKRHDTFAQQIMATLKAPITNFRQLRSMSKFGEEDESVFWALKDINFEVKEGEVLGIIGHNGAGKSTLLKILSRITEPTSGEINIKGRISALLEVGTGFHQDLTGRENVYMNGTILGMTKREIDAKFDEIVDFSGVEKYIDTPVKFYSSGMKVRLGFAVAAHLEPEILLIDEVLAVGDTEFQKKCLGKMESISQNNGRTLLFVSHNMVAIQSICQRVIVLNSGLVLRDGDIIDGVSSYNLSLTNQDINRLDRKKRIVINESVNEAGITEVKFNQPFTLNVCLQNVNNIKCSVYMIIYNANGENLVHERIDNIKVNKDRFVIKFKVPIIWLRPGVYNYIFKWISSDLTSANNRYVSEAYTLKVTGEVNAPQLLGSITPTIIHHIE